MIVHLVDGTYELFRHHFARPSHVTAAGQEVAATRGVLESILYLLANGATHVGVATDHVIESFRNNLYAGYKTSAGMPPELLSQFPIIEDALVAMGVVVWPMVEFEADDGLAAAAEMAGRDDAVEQVQILTPDKDLAQCVVDGRVVQIDRRRDRPYDEAGVLEKFGVLPESIPDWLALVGDSADGFPGIPGWGAKSAAAILRRYVHLEQIPVDATRWEGVRVRSGHQLMGVLTDRLQDALLFRHLATLRRDAPVSRTVDDLRWTGPAPEFAAMCERIDATRLVARAEQLAASR